MGKVHNGVCLESAASTMSKDQGRSTQFSIQWLIACEETLDWRFGRECNLYFRLGQIGDLAHVDWSVMEQG